MLMEYTSRALKTTMFTLSVMVLFTKTSHNGRMVPTVVLTIHNCVMRISLKIVTEPTILLSKLLPVIWVMKQKAALTFMNGADMVVTLPTT